MAVTLPLGLQAAGCWLRGPAPPPIRLLRLGACSRRRLRCQQTPGASLPGPPLSNSGPVSAKGSAANAGGGGGRFRGLPSGSRTRVPGPERTAGRPHPGGEHVRQGPPGGVRSCDRGSAPLCPAAQPAEPRQWLRAGLAPPPPSAPTSLGAPAPRSAPWSISGCTGRTPSPNALLSFLPSALLPPQLGNGAPGHSAVPREVGGFPQRLGQSPGPRISNPVPPLLTQ